MRPEYASPHAAGADLKAALETVLPVAPGERVMVPTGVYMALPQGWEGQVRPRSGLAWKQGLTLLNSPGTIDADYRGEVKIILINLGHETVSIEPGQRIAQLVIARAPQAEFQYTGSLSDSLRGSGGFGSTGK
ncbi:MAG: deoxyuridine 5'-triphosphate nucleotidohydrolase [Spirochaeta sp. LUC14_002_19_P3]|nr:MAG: deoxyuridine 5'-triphosphate nucleotidohydrolase [Spirochaeta sp. LUC14_002_19_P3]